jgi:hypothetical protein
MKREDRLVIIGLVTWFGFAFALGISGKFRDASAPLVAATVWTLTALALLACWKSSTVRVWVMNVDPRWLVAVHLTRFVGIYFLVLAGRGALPSGFARPAGLGDIAIAASALVILLIPQLLTATKVLLVWNVLGLVDILFVAFAALGFGLRDLQSMAPLRELLLSLLPTYIVPLILVSHAMIFARVKLDATSPTAV